VSTNITSEVGEVTQNSFKKGWGLQVLPEFSREKVFRELLIANSATYVLMIFEKTLIAFIQENYSDFRTIDIDKRGK
jgi:hypothetical protein